VDAEGVRVDARHQLAHGRRRQGRQLNGAEVGEQIDVRRRAPDVVGRRQLRVEQHRALAAEAERDTVRRRGGRERPVDRPRLRRPPRHPGDHERRADRPAAEPGGEVDVGRRALGERAVHEVHVVEQRGAMEVRRAGAGDRQVVRFALADAAAVRHSNAPV